MANLSKKVAKLHSGLERMKVKARPTQAEIDQVRDTVAALLLQALSDEEHPISQGCF